MRSLTLILALSLTGCSTIVTKTVRETPPTPLLAVCQEPKGPITTNRELAEAFLAMRQALRSCNNQLAALREWAKE